MKWTLAADYFIKKRCPNIKGINLYQISTLWSWTSYKPSRLWIIGCLWNHRDKLLVDSWLICLLHWIVFQLKCRVEVEYYEWLLKRIFMSQSHSTFFYENWFTTDIHRQKCHFQPIIFRVSFLVSMISSNFKLKSV